MWSQLKMRVRRKNLFPKFDKKVVELIKEEFLNIKKEDWSKAIVKVIKYEEEYRKLGQILFNGGERFVINLAEESDDGTDVFSDESFN